MSVRSAGMALIIGTVLSSCLAVWSADEREGVRHEKLYLLHADARNIAAMCAAVHQGASKESPAAPAARSRPARYVSGPPPLPPESRRDTSRPPELVAGARVAEPRDRIALAAASAEAAAQPAGPSGGYGGGGAGLTELLPGGMAPPIALPGENALLVTGTSAEIDAFREILQLLDAPQPQVRIRADIVNVLTRIEKGLGLDLGITSGPLGVGTAGNVPPDANLLLRFGTGNVRALLGAMQRESRGSERVGAEVMTTNNVPAMISAGQTVPYFVPETTVTFGAVTTNYIPYSAFVGMELYVLPRVNADDTVSMHIRPSLIDETGMVLGPGGAVPVTKQTLADVLIRVRDGETVCIGGLPRRQDFSTGTPLGTREVIDDSELLVFVTPTILRPITRP